MALVVIEENEVKKAYSEVEYDNEVYRLDYIITTPVNGVPVKIDCYMTKMLNDKKVQVGYGNYNKDVSTYVRFDLAILHADISVQSKLSKRFYDDVESVVNG